MNSVQLNRPEADDAVADPASTAPADTAIDVRFTIP